MPKQNSELANILRFIRRLLTSRIAKADKDTLRMILRELGQYRKMVTTRLGE